MTRFVSLLLALCAVAWPAVAQDRAALPAVEVSGARRQDVEKSYRQMLRGMDLFERQRAAMAPAATLRFRVLQRKPGVNLQDLEMVIVGRGIEIPIDVAADRTFTLPRDARAVDADAVVTPNRRRLTMTWRADVRTPGLPAGTRRLGDMRLECMVGMEAGLFSNSPSWIVRLYDQLDNTPAYCNRAKNEYLFFADRPLFGVTLIAGNRREQLPAGRLWAGATDDAGLRQDLPFCDCEMLVDRTYFLPLSDAGWPHDTLVVFDFMDAPDAEAGAPASPVVPGRTTRAELAALLGDAQRVGFDSGYELWVYRAQPVTPGQRELVVLFGPDGVARKVRVRDALR